ncbi:MAG TPA: ABC transporter permease [Bryobacteraceae bacterium]|jgi:predicted permease|nr:ABC transporter permease [Bryobacteraceae bacterium]
MLHDVRFALRQFAAAKAFTIAAVLTLALGIGANTGIFTLVNALMLRSLPVADPQRIVQFGDADNCCVIGAVQGRFGVYSYPLYQYVRDHTPEFEEMAAFQAGIEEVGVRRAGSQVSTPFVDQFVSGNYFTMFGLRPFAGRLLVPSDDARGAPLAAVVSYRAWQQHFGGDPAMVGSSMVIDGTPFTLVGVAPPGFFGAALQPDPPDFWLPLASETNVHGANALLDIKNDYWLYVFGRARPGLQTARVEAQVNGELQQWLHDNEPAPNAEYRRRLLADHIALVPGGAGLSEMRDSYRRDLRLLMCITGLVLLIACANLANLQLARGASAAGQMSIRVALGAPPSRLIRQVLVESTLLAVAGGGVGLLVAIDTAGLLLRLAFRSAHFVPIDSAPPLVVLGFAFGLSIVTGAVFGIVPAWSASRTDPAAALHGAGRSASGRSTLPQKTLVVLQAALALALVASAGLMTQTLRNLTGQQFGFQVEGTTVVDVNAGFAGYSGERLKSVYGEIDRQLRQIPGVRNVAMTLYSPMSGNNWQMGATLEEHPQQQIAPSWDRVSGSFFDAIGAHILRGRTFTDRDTAGAPQVAVVNQLFADRYFPNEDPIGKRFGLGGYENRADFQIVGIVNTIRFRDPRGPGRPMFFLPILQWKENWSRSNLIGSILLHTSGTTAGLEARIRHTMGAIDPNLTVLNVAPVAEHLTQLVEHEQLIGTLAQIFGGLALLLASVGLYGITAYSVARRTSEIGLRTALGATPWQVVKLILGSALSQAAVGIAVGIPLALGAGRLLSGLLFGVKTSDPTTLAGATVILLLCAAAASTIPAIRASSVDPVRALRVDN